MTLQNYISTIFAASVLGAVCCAVAGSAFEKYVRYLASLICILLIIHPFKELSLPSWNESVSADVSAADGNTLDALASSLAEEEICRAIASALSAETGITAAEVRIDIDWAEEQPLIYAVELTLPPEEADRAEEAAAWIEQSYGVPGRITEEGGDP